LRGGAGVGQREDDLRDAGNPAIADAIGVVQEIEIAVVERGGDVEAELRDEAIAVVVDAEMLGIARGYCPAQIAVEAINIFVVDCCVFNDWRRRGSPSITPSATRPSNCTAASRLTISNLRMPRPPKSQWPVNPTSPLAMIHFCAAVRCRSS